MRFLKKAVLLILSVFMFLFVVVSAISEPEAVGTAADVLYHKIALTSLFGSWFICCLSEFIYTNIKAKKEINISLKKRICIYIAVIIAGFALLFIFNGMTSDSFSGSAETDVSSDETVSDVASDDAVTEAETEKTTADNSVSAENIYNQLSDDEYLMLTEILAESFYSFTVSDKNNAKLQKNDAVRTCLESIFDYAYANYFELDPAFAAVFAEKHDIVEESACYGKLKENFDIGLTRDVEEKEWKYSIRSYSLDKDDVYIYDDVIYLDAEGYLNPGVAVYWTEDDKMVEVGEIVDIALDKEIDKNVYAYALNVRFFDDSFSSGWRDGENFLTANKKLAGIPAYFINALDPNRNIIKQVPDYNGSAKWTVLKNATIKQGTEVYVGSGYSKGYMFTIKSFDKKTDMIVVEYESGNVETKSYSAIVNNPLLYVKNAG